MAIKAVFWDFGGVLTTSPFAAFAAFERKNHLPPGFLRTVNTRNFNHNAWARFERGELDLAAFEQAYWQETQALGHPLAGRQVLELLYGELRPAMVAALHCCSRHYRTACLTNNMRLPDDQTDPLIQQRNRVFEPVQPLFEKIFESSELGLRKPDPRFYRYACQAMSVQPREVVFLDDLGVNLKPAREMGMQTIKVESTEQTVLALELTLAIDLKHCSPKT